MSDEYADLKAKIGATTSTYEDHNNFFRLVYILGANIKYISGIQEEEQIKCNGFNQFIEDLIAKATAPKTAKDTLEETQRKIQALTDIGELNQAVELELTIPGLKENIEMAKTAFIKAFPQPFEALLTTIQAPREKSAS